MLANYTWTDATDTLLISLANNESLTVSESAGSVSFTLSAGMFTQSGGNTAPGSGTATITLAAADIATSVTVNNSTVTTGTNNVAFSGAGALLSAAIAVNITDSDATGTISTTGGFDLTSLGAGGITLETTRNISLATGTSIFTTSGNVTLRANQQAVRVNGDFNGVYVNGATITTSGSGNILIEGRGGNSATGFNEGVTVANDARIESTSSAADAGTITLDGIGGIQSTSFADAGVGLRGAVVTSVSGDIQITGQGGGNGSAGSNDGVNLAAAEITSTGVGANAATIRINGAGGNADDFNIGMRLFSGGRVAAQDGDIEITATAGAGTFDALFLALGSSVRSTGTGTIEFITDGIVIQSTAVVDASASTVIVRTRTTTGAVGINLGGADAAGTLGISGADLDRISAGKIIIGDAATPNTISVSAPIQHAGDDNFEVLTARNIAFASGSSWTTTNGDLTFRANQGATSASGNFSSVSLANAAIVTNGSGDIFLQGRGGDTSSFNVGVDLAGAAKVQSTSTAVNAGTITIDGVGGLGSNVVTNPGVRLVGAGTLVTSVAGDIQITGKGGGRDINSSTNYGVWLDSSAVVSSTGTGANAATIAIDGTGGIGNGNNLGVRLSTSTLITSKDGDMKISAIAGQNPQLVFFQDGGGSIKSTGTADIEIASDAVLILDAGSTIDAGANTVTIKTKTTSGAIGIDIGGADTSTALGLSDAELDRITAGKIIIGDATIPNTITVSAAIQHAGDANFEVLTARNISFIDDSSWTTTDGDLSFIANQGATPTTGNFAGVRLQTATITTNGAGNILLQGRGGDTGGDNSGVELAIAAKVQSTSTAADAGTITINGVGGAGTNAVSNSGVRFFGSGTLVTSVVGDIQITGKGGGRDATSSTNYGVDIDSSAGVSSTGTGADAATITIDGTGGIGNGANDGVTLTSSVSILSKDGDIQITAAAGQATVLSYVQGGGVIVQSAGTADISMVSDAFLITDPASVINAGPNTVTLKTKTNNGAIRIDIGGADNSFTLGLSDDELDRITAGTIVIGDAVTPNVVSVVAAIQHARDANFEVLSAREIGINAPLGSWTSTAGDLAFRANQEATPSPGNFSGITVNGGFIHSTSGDITLEGRGGDGGSLPGSQKYGIIVQNSGNVGQTSGKVTLNGTGGGKNDGTENYGVYIVDAGSEVSADGLGTVNILGIGGAGIGGRGIFITTGAVVTSSDGEVKLTGIGTSTGEAINVSGGAEISSTSMGDVTLVTDSLVIEGATTTIRAAAAGDGTVTIQTRTPGAFINLGGSDNLPIIPFLGLTDAELDRVFAGTLIIGNTDSGNLEVVADITRTAATDMQLISHNDVIISGGQVNTGGGTLLLHPGDSPAAVKPTKAGIDATASTVSFDSDLTIAINGATVDSGYNQLNVAGAVDLRGVDLVLSGSYVPQGGNAFTIVSATNVIGQFNGLVDGSKITFNGVELTVRYTATAVILRAGRTAEDIIALGADAGAKPRVKVIDSQTGEVITSFLAYSSTFKGGVRVAVADMNGDGQAEIIVAPGAGMSTLVKVFDLAGHELTDFRTTAYAGFSGGVFVAAGDVNGDGRVDLITTPGAGLASTVKVFKNRVGITSTSPDPLSNSPIYAFNAFGSTFKGGATVAAGDVTGDGRADIVVGNGPGMSPHVRLFDTSLIDPPPPTGKITLGPFLYQITPFNSTDRGGVFVAIGNVRGDSRAEIIIGNGVAGRGRVEMYNPDGSRFKSVTAYSSSEGNSAPTHVATKNVVDTDSYDEVLTAQGVPGGVRQLRSFESDGKLIDSVLEDDADFRFGFFVA